MNDRTLLELAERDISPSISAAQRWASAFVSKVAERVGCPFLRICARQALPRFSK